MQHDIILSLYYKIEKNELLLIILYRRYNVGKKPRKANNTRVCWYNLALHLFSSPHSIFYVIFTNVRPVILRTRIASAPMHCCGTFNKDFLYPSSVLHRQSWASFLERPISRSGAIRGIMAVSWRVIWS